MQLIFYHTNDNQNTINKTLDKITEIKIHLTSGQDINNLQLLLTNNSNIDYSTINYASMLDNYYFASSELIKNGTLIRLNLKKDVLETYKDDILKCEADIIAKTDNNDIGNIPISKKVETKIFKADTTLNKTQSVIMVTVASKGE